MATLTQALRVDPPPLRPLHLHQVRKMHAFELRLLVCTDLLARGVDFGRVNLVPA